LPSFSAQYTCRTQEGLTEKVTLPVYTARNGETKKKQKRRKREGGLQCTMSADTKEQRSCWDFPRISAPSLFHQHFLMQNFHRNNLRLLESIGLQTLFSCRDISSIQE